MSRSELNLLLVNWQDLRNPQAGGAEIHLHQIYGRLASRGHRITLLCSGWPGCEPREQVDGLQVHRVGGRYSFALRAHRYYRAMLSRTTWDLVVEDINKVPLYSPRWVAAPVVALVPHLFGTTAFREASVPLASAVWLAERPLPRIYRDVPFEAISESTADDLTARGIRRERIRVIHPGIDHDRFRPDPKWPRFESPTFVYVGRLKRYKGLERVIDAIADLAEEGMEVALLIAGKGDHERALRRHASRRAGKHVRFLGYVSEEQKVDLLRRAWATVYPSPKEGWGITNIEAAACGTPAVASDAPGLRESVAEGRSGLLVPHDDRGAWTLALKRVVCDDALRRRLQEGAPAYAAHFSWARAADETESHLQEVLSGSRGRAPTPAER